MLIGANAFAQVSLGAGYVNSTTGISYKDNSSDSSMGGFYVGASYNLPIASGLGIAPGLYYEFLTASDKSSYAGIAEVNGDTKEHYINVPVMFNYGYDLTPNFRIFAFAGPTASFGIASNTTIKGSALGLTANTKIDNYDKDYDYGRVDVMVGGGIGADIMNMVQFKIGYDYGLLNRYTGDTDNYSRHRSQLHVGLAFLF